MCSFSDILIYIINLIFIVTFSFILRVKYQYCLLMYQYPYCGSDEMNWFKELKVGTKLIGMFLIASCFAGIIGTLGIQSIDQVRSFALLMYDREIMGLRHAADARMNLVAAGRAGRGVLLAQDPRDHAREYATMEEHFAQIRAALDRSTKLLAEDSELAIVAQAQDAVSAYQTKFNDIISRRSDTAADGSRDSLAAVMQEALPIAINAENMVTALLIQKQSNADALSRETELVYANVLQSMILMTLGSVLSSIILGALLARSLTRQLGGEPRDVAMVADAIASGDLTTQIEVSKTRQGSIVRAMHRMQESLRSVVGSVRSSSDIIATGTGQIAAGNLDLSQRTEEQAANLTQTAAAMEQLSSTVKSNADAADQAARLASLASVAVDNGGQVVNDVVAVMAEINQSSQQIHEIIGVIDSIAFQTNILALNAAVEAARAGGEGRGFAVVASEVRSLAQKSATAARDIKALITDSVEKVETGRKMADVAGTTMLEAVTQVKRVNDLISDISAATTEQTSGLEQINKAVYQLSDVTQQNAALVEESAMAAQSLNDQAAHLVAIVQAFSLDDRVEYAEPIADIEKQRADQGCQSRSAQDVTQVSKSVLQLESVS